jgi:hypothetical protein
MNELQEGLDRLRASGASRAQALARNDPPEKHLGPLPHELEDDGVDVESTAIAPPLEARPRVSVSRFGGKATRTRGGRSAGQIAHPGWIKKTCRRGIRAYVGWVKRTRTVMMLVSVLAIAFAAGCGGGHPRSVSLTIRLVQGGFGPRSYTLSCLPPGGTAPGPAKICAAIRQRPSLLIAHRGAGHSCPYGPPVVVVSGSWAGRRVGAGFSVCTSGQENQAARWIQLLHYGPVRVLRAAKAKAGLASLVLSQRAPGLTRVYQYGAIWQLAIKQVASGRTAFAADFYTGFRGAWPVRLPPGEYRIESAELVCNGNCDQLSAPTDRCARVIRLENGTLPILIDVHAGRVCQISVT